MDINELKRPDKLLWKGLQTLTDLGQGLYSNQKSAAKAKAELTFIGERKLSQVQQQLYTYDLRAYEKIEDPKEYSFLQQASTDRTHWLNLHGLHDVELIKALGNQAQLDRLTIRHILDTTQRPKVEDYEQYLFFSVKSVLKDESSKLYVEQLSFVLGAQYIISFQEEVSDHFEGIRNKLAEGLGLIRKKKSDYLLAQLLDAILDNYFETIEQINQEIDLIEAEVFKNPSNHTLIALENEKRSAQLIKKSLGPFKDALMNIMNGRTSLIKKNNHKYFKDLLNSASAAIEETDNTLKTLEGLSSIYFASLSQKMNETMKVLTTVATIFIPLTFIAGIYGMNFENMPELKYRYGYFITWGVMGMVALGMVVYFKRKQWI